MSSGRWTRITISGALVLCMAVAVGCGKGDTTTNVVIIPGPTPTATPLPSAAGKENLFGSTAPGGGALTISPLAVIPVYFSQSLGNDSVYIGSDPGFKEADADDSSIPLYTLPDGVTVTLEVIAIDSALSLMFENGTTLTAAGQSVVLGTTPGIHADLEWQLLLAAGAPFGAGHPVTLKLTTTSSAYTSSAEFTETIRPSAGSPSDESE